MVGNSVSWTIGRSSTFGLNRPGFVRASSTSDDERRPACRRRETVALAPNRLPRAVQMKEHTLPGCGTTCG